MLAFLRTLITLTVFLTVCAFTVSFALSNKEIVTVILPWIGISISLPLCVLVIAALLFGGMSAMVLLSILAFPKQRALKRSEKIHRRTVNAQKQEIEVLRLESRYADPH